MCDIKHLYLMSTGMLQLRTSQLSCLLHNTSPSIAPARAAPTIAPYWEDRLDIWRGTTALFVQTYRGSPGYRRHGGQARISLAQENKEETKDVFTETVWICGDHRGDWSSRRGEIRQWAKNLPSQPPVVWPRATNIEETHSHSLSRMSRETFLIKWNKCVAVRLRGVVKKLKELNTKARREYRESRGMETVGDV